jgi:hypothetical protein
VFNYIINDITDMKTEPLRNENINKDGNSRKPLMCVVLPEKLSNILIILVVKGLFKKISGTYVQIALFEICDPYFNNYLSGNSKSFQM